MTEPVGDIALIGLAVMGQNLILNMNDHGYTVVAYNRTVAKVDEFLAGPAKGTNIIGATAKRNRLNIVLFSKVWQSESGGKRESAVLTSLPCDWNAKRKRRRSVTEEICDKSVIIGH